MWDFIFVCAVILAAAVVIMALFGKGFFKIDEIELFDETLNLDDAIEKAEEKDKK